MPYDARRSPAFFFFRTLPLMVVLTALAILLVDYPLAAWIRDNVGDQHKKWLWLLARPGRGEPWTIVIFLMLAVPWALSAFFKKDPQKLRFWQMGGIYAALTLGISTLLVAGAKYAIGRPRPHFAFKIASTVLEPFNGGSGYAAFPSGHAQTAWAGAFALGFLFPRIRWPLYFLALLTSLSRIGMNRHYLSDTLAGFTVALGCAVVFHWLIRPEEHS